MRGNLLASPFRAPASFWMYSFGIVYWPMSLEMKWGFQLCQCCLQPPTNATSLSLCLAWIAKQPQQRRKWEETVTLLLNDHTYQWSKIKDMLAHIYDYTNISKRFKNTSQPVFWTTLFVRCYNYVGINLQSTQHLERAYCL
jgi:hypothetical protein